jgi:linoleoyl-CoA desaturase
VRFEPRDPALRALHDELRAVVDDYFVRTGGKRTANAAMVAKTVFWLAAAAALYAVLVVGALPPLWAWPAAGLLGVVMAAVGFNVGHDAIHGAWSERAWVNRLLGRTFDVLGASSTTWAEAHNFVHHTYTNVPGVDHDLEPGPFMVFHPEKAPSWIHRFQHLYAFPLYLFTFVVWVFKKDLQQVLSPDPRSGLRHGAADVAGVVFFKLVHFALFLGLPLLLLSGAPGFSPWMVVVGYLTMIAGAGLTLAVVFQLAHVVEPTTFPVPDAERRIDDSWAAHQLRTTANFAPDSPFWNFFTGGLNHQIEHHLFYKICHIHYPALAPLVADVARRHGVPYHVLPTFRAALASHVRTMRRLGAPRPTTTTTATAATSTSSTPTPAAAATLAVARAARALP